MHSAVIVGLQYGDEGKARVVDDQSSRYDIVARFNGGANAGHTVEANGVRVALNQVPSGIFYPDKKLYIGSGCVVNIKKLYDEIKRLNEIGIKLEGRLHISPQAGIIQAHHVAIDTLIGGEVGTTKNGIGPAYADRALRMWGDRLLNLRMGDMKSDPEAVLEMIKKNYEESAKIYNLSNIDVVQFLDEIKSSLDVVLPFVEMNPLFLKQQVDGGATVIFEGAQSFMLDVNKGDVPYVTSSHTASAAAHIGGDLPTKYHGKTIGIAKAIMSRVGHGPFVSEFGGAESEEYCMSYNETGGPLYGRAVESAYDIEALLASENSMDMSKAIRNLSGEYGTVTTRPRRVGALDLVQLRYAIQANGVDEMVITKCDLLNIYSRTAKGKIPMVVAYELDGQKIDYLPGSTFSYKKVKPVFEYFDSFSEDVSGVRKFEDLPMALQNLVKKVEEFTGCPVKGLGVGPAREHYVAR